MQCDLAVYCSSGIWPQSLYIAQNQTSSNTGSLFDSQYHQQTSISNERYSYYRDLPQLLQNTPDFLLVRSVLLHKIMAEDMFIMQKFWAEKEITSERLCFVLFFTMFDHFWMRLSAPTGNTSSESTLKCWSVYSDMRKDD